MANTNMNIAKLHRWSRKFVGTITAAGPIIAYVLSFVTVAAGVILYAMVMFPTMKGYWLVSGFIGVLFSFLVERMTLTQAAKVRQVSESSDDIKNKYARVENPTKEVKQNCEIELKEAKKGRVGATFLMVLGILISTAAGTLFWHYVLQPLPVWQAWAFSTLFSAVISFTLVASELHRRLENRVVSESIVADHFIGAAAAEDARDQAIDRFAGMHQGALNGALDNRTVTQMADATAQSTIDSVFGGRGMIPAHISREREAARAAQEREAALTREQMRLINGANTPSSNGRSKVTTVIGGTEPLSFDNPFQTGAH